MAIERREERRLGVLGPVERARPGRPRRASLIGSPSARSAAAKTAAAAGDGLGEGPAHADGLRSLAGEDEGIACASLARVRARAAVTRRRPVHGCTDVRARPVCFAAWPTERDPATSRHAAARAGAIARRFEADLSAPVLAAGNRLPNVRQISERVAMGRALWRELVIGFAGAARRAAPRVHPARGAVRPRRRRAR